jgi:hypothetical protein
MPNVTVVPPAQDLRAWALVLGLLVLTAVLLLAMGRDPICACGYVRIWGGVTGPENSQHLTDWYTPSHVLHGFIFYAVMWILVPHRAFEQRMVGAVVLASVWELVENTSWLIERYRGTTVSLDYNGDSVINSVTDIGFMMVGFWLASRLPVNAVILVAVAVEATTLIVIRDSLALNIVMLLWPIEAVLEWQSRP